MLGESYNIKQGGAGYPDPDPDNMGRQRDNSIDSTQTDEEEEQAVRRIFEINTEFSAD